MSCSQGQSCKVCDAHSGTVKTGCYANGCACFGKVVTLESECVGASKEAARVAYNCSGMDRSLVLPGGAMVTISVYDFDTGPLDDYVEQLKVPRPAYVGKGRTSLGLSCKGVV